MGNLDEWRQVSHIKSWNPNTESSCAKQFGHPIDPLLLWSRSTPVRITLYWKWFAQGLSFTYELWRHSNIHLTKANSQWRQHGQFKHASTFPIVPMVVLCFPNYSMQSALWRIRSYPPSTTRHRHLFAAMPLTGSSPRKLRSIYVVLFGTTATIEPENVPRYLISHVGIDAVSWLPNGCDQFSFLFSSHRTTQSLNLH